MKDGSEITASDRVQITDGGRLLSIANVTRDDQGSYTCKVSNPVNSDTSDPANVTVSYGPEKVKLTPPAGTDHAVGSDITMVCSADSRPPAQFTWFLNGSQLRDIGSELKLVDVQENQSGSYSCQAFNTETLRNQTSEPAVINILVNVSDASVKPTNPPVEGTSLNLTCEASGSVLSRKWMKDDSDLILTDNMKLHDNNRVLSFTTVSRNDNGEYVCHISNSFSSMLAAFSLTVNYGPENVKISGENQIKVGSTIKLSCTADSEPLAEFTWLFNETQILNSSSELIKDNANISDSGTYTCRATNEITGKSGSAEHRLSVTNTSGDNNSTPPGPDCDTGCIVGIVVACVVVVAVAIGVGCYCVQKKKKKKKSTSTTTGGGARGNAGNKNEDLNYADVRFFRNKQGVSVPLGEQNTTTDYAEVRVNNKGPGPSSPPTYDDHMQRTKRSAPQPGVNGGPAHP
ncbi:carcinoembryonic antigen-related cell adhesion molecule 5-like isoform X2 [Salarias fasciatus]|nr:carcinoembryonic antigen-related cell adhesion molecule 5-like isoform X2 [Salarias fasciatus]